MDDICFMFQFHVSFRGCSSEGWYIRGLVDHPEFGDFVPFCFPLGCPEVIVTS